MKEIQQILVLKKSNERDEKVAILFGGFATKETPVIFVRDNDDLSIQHEEITLDEFVLLNESGDYKRVLFLDDIKDKDILNYVRNLKVFDMEGI